MINVAIFGVGNNASALVQGVEYYKKNPEKIIGIMPEVKDYSLKDINFVLGFDIDSKKVGKDLSEAIFEKPNCSIEIHRPDKLDAPVLRGHALDDIGVLSEHVPVDENQQEVNIKEELVNKKTDVVVIVLPTGFDKSVQHYAKEAISAGCAVVNGIPTEIATNSEIIKLAEENNVPVIGDDIKSQIGATIIHRALTNLFPMRGAMLDRTIQLDWGGGMDFCNLMGNKNYDSGKKRSKTESVVAELQNKDKAEVQIDAVDYIPFLNGVKEAYMRLEGRIFGGAPVRTDIVMQVQDNFNSAGILVDAIRVSKIAKDRKVGGAFQSACSLFNKRPPEQLPDEVAKKRLVEFLEGKRER